MGFSISAEPRATLSPEYDSGLLWNDKTINIDWRLEEFGIKKEELTISDKDQKQAKFDKNKKYFE